MKKVLKVLVLVILLIGNLVFLTACGEEKSSSSSSSSETKTKASLSIEYNGVNVVPGTKFDESRISDNAEISEIPSCAFDGVDKVYNYPNVEITVAEVNGTPTVYSVYFKDDTISTNEGVKISDSKDLMLEKYGENYKNTLSSKYDYTKENVELSFIVENDIITGIEYTLITEN